MTYKFLLFCRLMWIPIDYTGVDYVLTTVSDPLLVPARRAVGRVRRLSGGKSVANVFFPFFLFTPIFLPFAFYLYFCFPQRPLLSSAFSSPGSVKYHLPHTPSITTTYRTLISRVIRRKSELNTTIIVSEWIRWRKATQNNSYTCIT